MNQACADIFMGRGTNTARMKGRSLAQLYDRAFATERMALIRATLKGGRPVLFRAFWRGRQHYSWLTPHDDLVLVVTRRHGATMEAGLEGAASSGYRRIDSSVVGLGPLAELTPPERVVLALLGDGMSAAEAAAALSRSPNTVRTHQRRIGEKLGVHGRAALVKYVQRIGLTLGDVSGR
ncbi:MAG: helix-turn-helix transcriptional regulator [Planctomycetota bacterium]